MKLVFTVATDEEADEVRYTCHDCNVTEFGGPVGNPGLIGRMRAHAREGHDFPRDRKVRGRISGQMGESYDLSLEITDEVEVTEAPEPRSTGDWRDDPQWMPARKVYREFIVDTNCVNARRANLAMNKLEAWAESGVIGLLTAEVAQNEMLAGNNAARTSKAYTFLFTMSEVHTESEQRSLREIERMIFPSGAGDANQRNDVEIVFNSAKYMRPLITNDGASKSQPGGILGNRAALAQRGITVLTPQQAVAIVQRAIERRDTSARKMARLLGKPVPEWVGND